MQTTLKNIETASAALNEIELYFEELEEVIAPQGSTPPNFPLPRNHNETLASDEIELCVEELEEVIAPGYRRGTNHNETLASDEIELSVEELEEVIAPQGVYPPTRP